MQVKSVYISAGLHVLVFIAATVSIPWLRRDFEIPPPIMVEFVEVSKITQTDKVAPEPAKEEKKEEKPPEDKPPPAAQNVADEAVVPVKKEEKIEDKEPPKKKEEILDENAPPEKKKKEKKPKKEEKKETPKEKPKDFSSVLKNLDLAETKPTPSKEPDLKTDEAAVSPDGQNAPLGAKMTISEEDALRVQLQQCWNVPFGAKDAENLKVDIFMVINPDRTLREARIVDTSRYNNDTFFRAAADSALRAVRSPLCSPFQVPPDKYDTWKNVTVTFDPKNMF